MGDHKNREKESKGRIWGGYRNGGMEWLLQGLIERSGKVLGRHRGWRENEEEELSREEIRKALNKVKDNKAVGVDKIPGEVWKYGGRV